MRRSLLRPVLWAAVAGLCFLESCVELTGQRITIRHDEAKDRLQILIQYDGIHDNEGEGESGREQIPHFVKAGSVMLLDWPFHIDMDDIRGKAEAEGDSPAMRALLLAMPGSIEARPIGRYRDPDGRVGAAQLVTISGVRDFLRKVNAALNESILEGAAFSDWPRTRDRMRPGAAQGRQWLVLEGQSLRFSFPAHPGEWAKGKSAWIRGLLEEWAKSTRPGEAPEYVPAFYLQALALFPASLEETSDEIVIRLGEPARSSTYRFSIRDAYEANLEEVVAQTIPAELDADLAAALLSPEPPAADSALTAVSEWGPPEEKARALVAAAEKPDEATRQAALERLRALGAEVTEAGLLPPAPPAPASDAALEPYVALWKDWYRRAIRQPE